MADIVLISGKMGSGKSTLAKAIMNHGGTKRHYFLKCFKFADALYELQDVVLDKMEELSGIKRVKKDGTLLQLLGTEWGRTRFGSDIWVSILKRQVEAFTTEFRSDKCLIVIDDCRFENEFNAFPGALKVRLEADRDARKYRADSWRDNEDHPSETSLDAYFKAGKFDLVFDTTHADSVKPEVMAVEIFDYLFARNLNGPH